MVRKTPAAVSGLAVLALAALALVGCSAGAPAACDRPAVSDPAVMDLITVSGDADEAPEIDIPTPLRLVEGGYHDVITGEGTPLTAPSQLSVLDITLVNGATGETIVQAPSETDLTAVFPTSAITDIIPAFESALQCATEGSRVVVALAPGDMSADLMTRFGLAEDDSAVAVIDVRKVYLPRAEGTLQFNSGNGLPSISRAPDGRPGISFPDAAAPTDLVIQTLIKGDGDIVTGDAPVRVHYSGAVWGADETFDSSWDGEGRSLTLDGVVPGFAAALEGQTVGSQVMVVVPPDQGYGDQAQGSIPAGSTLVFVIDILGLDAASTQ